MKWGSSSGEGRCHGNQFWDAICITGFVGYNFGCIVLFQGWVFRVKLSDEDIAEIECLRVVAMATNFWD